MLWQKVSTILFLRRFLTDFVKTATIGDFFSILRMKSYEQLNQSFEDSDNEMDYSENEGNGMREDNEEDDYESRNYDDAEEDDDGNLPDW